MIPGRPPIKVELKQNDKMTETQKDRMIKRQKDKKDRKIKKMDR